MQGATPEPARKLYVHLVRSRVHYPARLIVRCTEERLATIDVTIIDVFRRLSVLSPVPTPVACQLPLSTVSPQMIRADSPLTPRGQAHSKVSHPSGNCNDNFACTNDYGE